MRELFVKSARASLPRTSVSAARVSAGPPAGPLSPLSSDIRHPHHLHTRSKALNVMMAGVRKYFLTDPQASFLGSDWLLVSQMRAYYIVIV